MPTSAVKLAFTCTLLLLLTACASAPTPPIYAAAAKGTFEEVESLLEQGANPNVVGGFWDQPILGALANRNLEDPELIPIVEALLEAGADPNGIQANGSIGVWSTTRPLVWIVSWDKFDCDPHLAGLFIEAGADLSFSGGYRDTPLFYASKNGNLECAQMLIDAGAEITNERTVWGFGNSSITEEMEKQGWDIQALRARGIAAEENRQLQEQLAAEAAERAAVQAAIDAYQQRLDDTWNRDAALPADIRRDKYLVAFSNAMKESLFDDAHFYAQLLERNGLGLEDSLYYFWGQALVELNEPEQAVEKLGQYLARAGSSGQYYSQALALMIRAENM